jgi:hypothetical protein
MTLQLLLAAILGAAVLLAMARLLHWQSTAPPAAKAPQWRLVVLLAAQPLCAALLYLTLVPPPVTTAAGMLVVAARGAGRMPMSIGQHVVALPEASVSTAIERVPDLGTALRRYPEAQRIVVVGEGLPRRDREAARGLPLRFAPGEPPRGIVRLDLPPRAVPGAGFAVGGRVAGHAGGSVELLDPAGRVADRAILTSEGTFALRGVARAAGVALFGLRLRDDDGDIVEAAAVPLVTAAEVPPRILLLAGAPGPEPKFLRRWAADAGLALHAQYPTGGGMAIGDAPLPITASTLARFDLAILDDRSWAALGAGERAALVGAVRGGLGLVLRVTAPLPDATRRQWQALGFTVTGGSEVTAVRLAAREAPLTRRNVRVSGGDMLPLLRDSAGVPLAQWRQEARGRVAIWPLIDSYTLALGGTDARYAELWSSAFAALARGRPTALPRLDGVGRAGERALICGLDGDVDLHAPAGATLRLLADRLSGCAAFWPERAGWHQLQPAGGAAWLFHVVPGDALPGVRAAEARHATTRLASAAAAASDAATRTRPGSSWPWFLAWIAASAALWWFERARAAPSHRER